MGLHSTPEGRCPFDTDSACSGLECRDCEVFISKFGEKWEWVCVFCSPNRWDSMGRGLPEERTIPGAYASGVCPRCRNQRLALVPVSL